MKSCVNIIGALWVLVLLFTTAGADGEVLGTADTLLKAMSDPGATTAETPLGDTAAYVIRVQTEAAVVVLPGGDFQANLMGGPVTLGDLRAVFPSDEPLAQAWVSPAQLKQVLEHGFSHLVLDEKESIDHSVSAFDGFPQLSGCTVQCDVSAPVGARVVSIKLEDGSELNLEDEISRFTLVSTQKLLSGAYGGPVFEYEMLDASVVSGFADYLRENGVVTEVESGCIRIIGSTDNSLFSKVPLVLPIMAVILFAGASGIHKRKKLLEMEQEQEQDRRMR